MIRTETRTASLADLAAAQKLGPRPACRRTTHGKLEIPASTDAQNAIVRTWIARHASDQFMIGNIPQVADAREYLHRLAEQMKLTAHS